MRRFLRLNSLSIVFLALFLLAIGGQSIAGWQEFNNQAIAHKEEVISFGRYLTSSNFGQAVLENWQSEYLQFTLYILLTVWFIQRGSTESKQPGREGAESDREQQLGEHASADSPLWARVGGLRTTLYSNSLVSLMLVIWVLCWLVQSITGWSSYNDDLISHQQHVIGWTAYLGSADFWQTTLQNWQSEFLAVGSMAVFSVYLRQRGSPESKPVGAPDAETGSEG